MFLHTKLQKRASYGIPMEFSNVFGHFPAKKFDLSRIDKYRHICLLQFNIRQEKLEEQGEKLLKLVKDLVKEMRTHHDKYSLGLVKVVQAVDKLECNIIEKTTELAPLEYQILFHVHQPMFIV